MNLPSSLVSLLMRRSSKLNSLNSYVNIEKNTVLALVVTFSMLTLLMVKFNVLQ